MQATPVIAIFDVGKTNKKLFLFNEDYHIVFEDSVCLAEITDEDGDPCEDVKALQAFILSSLQKALQNKSFQVKAVNFSAYGASFVHVNGEGGAAAPLYNYLKAYPKDLQQQFYDAYGSAQNFSLATASPVLGHLNSGLQLYWLKHHKPEVFNQIACSLHLPQYLSFLLTGKYYSELTSIGCHTALWDFSKKSYHNWVYQEGMDNMLAPVVASGFVTSATLHGGHYPVGIGLHDSSAAMIPYLASFSEPFILLSTGTWCISLNPFNQNPLSAQELQQDCLCYLTYEGKPVKASRLFAGYVHEQQTARLAAYYGKNSDYYKGVRLNLQWIAQGGLYAQNAEQDLDFAKKDLSQFDSYEEAYHALMQDLVCQQQAATQLVLEGSRVKRIFVDGGFSKNELYMHLMAMVFPQLEVYAASMAQASAIGAAIAIHSSWSSKHLPTDVIELKYYGIAQDV